MAIVKHVNSKFERKAAGTASEVIDKMLNVSEENQKKVIELMNKNEGENWMIKVYHDDGTFYGAITSLCLMFGIMITVDNEV